MCSGRGTPGWPTPGGRACRGRPATEAATPMWISSLPTSRRCPGPGRRARSTRSACPTSPRPSCPSAPRSRRSASCARCCAATRSGARGCPSPTPAPTWPRCAPRRAPEGDTFVVSGQKTWNSLGPPCRLVPALRAHRPRSPQAQRDQLPAGRHGHARHHGATVAHHERRLHLLRALLRRGRRPPIVACSARSTTGGGWP